MKLNKLLLEVRIWKDDYDVIQGYVKRYADDLNTEDGKNFFLKKALKWIVDDNNLWQDMNILHKDVVGRINQYDLKDIKAGTLVSYDLERMYARYDNFLEHIFDWIRSLERSDNEEGLKSLRGIQTIQQAYQMANRYFINANKKASNKEDWEGIEVVHEFNDGFKMVKLTSEQSLAREGKLMNNCVGDYFEDVVDEYVEIYSLRDPNNNPHVTIELDTSDDSTEPEVEQIKGKGNEAPDKKYWGYVRTFINEKDFLVTSDGENIGLTKVQVLQKKRGMRRAAGVRSNHWAMSYYQPKKTLYLDTEQIVRLFENLTWFVEYSNKVEQVIISSSLDLSDWPRDIKWFGSFRNNYDETIELKIEGNLDLRNSKITSLPQRTTITGNLYTKGSALKTRPTWFNVDGKVIKESILLEYNPEQVNKEFGDKLVDRFIEEMIQRKIRNEYSGRTQPPMLDRLELYRKKLESEYDGKTLLSQIESFDPSSNNAFVPWIARTYVKGGIRYWEDISSRVQPALLAFIQIKRRKIPGIEKDINKYKSLGQLEDAADIYYKSLETKTDKKDIEKELIKNNEVEILYNNPKIKVVSPKTEKASCYYGRNTRWCTAATNGRNWFEEYDIDGPLYIIIIKKKNQRYQFQFETDQFMDEKDRELTTKEKMALTREYPILKKLFDKKAKEHGWYEFYDPDTTNLDKMSYDEISEILSHDSDYFHFFPKISEDTLIKAIEYDGTILEDIDDPSEKVQLAAIRDYAENLRYIKRPAESVQIEIMKEQLFLSTDIRTTAFTPLTLTILINIIEKLLSKILREPNLTLSSISKKLDNYYLSNDSINRFSLCIVNNIKKALKSGIKPIPVTKEMEQIINASVENWLDQKAMEDDEI